MVLSYVHRVRAAAEARQRDGPLAHDESARHWLLLEMVETKVEDGIRRCMAHHPPQESGEEEAAPLWRPHASPWEAYVERVFATTTTSAAVVVPEERKVETDKDVEEGGRGGVVQEGKRGEEDGVATSVLDGDRPGLPPASSLPAPSSSSSLYATIDSIILADSDLSTAHSPDLVPVVLLHHFFSAVSNARAQKHFSCPVGEATRWFPPPPLPLSFVEGTRRTTTAGVWPSCYPSCRLSDLLFSSIGKEEEEEEERNMRCPSLSFSSFSRVWPAAALVRAAIIGMALGAASPPPPTPSFFPLRPISLSLQNGTPWEKIDDPNTFPSPSSSSSFLTVLPSSSPAAIAMRWCLSFLTYRHLPSLSSSSSCVEKGWGLPFSFKSVVLAIAQRPSRYTHSFWHGTSTLQLRTRRRRTTAPNQKEEKNGPPPQPQWHPKATPTPKDPPSPPPHGEGEEPQTAMEVVGIAVGAGSTASSLSSLVTDGWGAAWNLVQCIPAAVLQEDAHLLHSLESTRKDPQANDAGEEEQKKGGNGSPSCRIRQDDPPACFLFLPGALTAAQVYFSHHRRPHGRHRRVPSSSPPSPRPRRDEAEEEETAPKKKKMEAPNESGRSGAPKRWIETRCLSLACGTDQKEKNRRSHDLHGDGVGNGHDELGSTPSSVFPPTHPRVPSMVWETYWSVMPPPPPLPLLPLSERSSADRPTTTTKEKERKKNASFPPDLSSVIASVVSPQAKGEMPMPLGRLMGLCRQVGGADERAAVVALFLHFLHRRCVKATKMKKTWWEEEEKKKKMEPSVRRCQGDGDRLEDRLFRASPIAVQEANAARHTHTAEKEAEEEKYWLLHHPSEVPSVVLQGVHPSVFNHTLAVLAVEQECDLVLAWYHRLLSFSDGEGAAAVPPPSSASPSSPPIINFFTHLVIVQMFLSPSALVWEHLPREQRSWSSLSSSSFGCPPPRTWYTTKTFEVCANALRRCTGQCAAPHPESGTSSSSLPPAAVLWRRRGIGPKLEERLALWEMVTQRTTSSSCSPLFFPSSSSSSGGEPPLRCAASRVPPTTPPSSWQEREGRTMSSANRHEDVVSARMRRWLLFVLHLLLQQQQHHLPFPEGVEKKKKYDPTGPANGSATAVSCVAILLDNDRRPWRGRNGGEGSALCRTVADWRADLEEGLTQLVASWSVMGGEKGSPGRRGGGWPVPPASEERKMVDVACMAVAMLLSISPTRLSPLAREETKWNGEGNEKESGVPRSSSSTTTTTPFVVDPLPAVLQKTGLLSRLRVWVGGSQPRLNHVIDRVLQNCLAMYSPHQGRTTTAEASIGEEEGEGGDVLRKEWDEKAGWTSPTDPDASLPPCVVGLFSSSLVAHHDALLTCVAGVMRWDALRSTLLPSSSSAAAAAAEDATPAQESAAVDRRGADAVRCTMVKKPRISSPALATWKRWASVLLLLTTEEDTSHHGRPQQRQAENAAETGRDSGTTSHHSPLCIAHGASIVVASGSDPLAALSFLSPSS